MSETDSATAILSTASVVDTPESPIEPAPSTPADSPDPQTPAEAVTESPAADSPTDGTPAAVPTTAQIRASLKAFREASPEHAAAARLLNDGYSRYEAYKSVFPTVEDARSTLAQLETIGGLEGLAELQSLASSIETTDSLLESGNPTVLDQIIEDAPEGFKQLAGPYLSKLAKLDSNAYVRAVQPHFVRFLTDANFPAVMNALAQYAEKPEAKALVNDIMRWFGEQKSLSDRFASDTLSPERERFNKERETFLTEQRQQLTNEIRQSVTTHINQELGGRLKQYAASLNALPIGQRQAVARACINELAAAIDADQTYQKMIEPLMNSRRPNKDRIVNLNRAKVTAFADAVVKKVAKDFGLTPGAAPAKAAAAKTAQKTPTSTKIVKLSQPPKDSEINWDFPDAQKAYIMHRAALKDGRLVSW